MLTFLNRDHTDATRVDRHLGASPMLEERPMVNVWNTATGRWEGPCLLITWGRGYATIYPQGLALRGFQHDVFGLISRQKVASSPYDWDCVLLTYWHCFVTCCIANNNIRNGVM